VYLNPFLTPVPERPGVLQGTALPPSFVLRRGYGSGLERMYVFLALLQQSGLDGCLVGPPDAANSPAGFVALGPDKQAVLTGSPRGPFWAVGVRVGRDVRLYDPWRGAPFPAPLGELKAKPEAHKAWFDGKDNPSGVTAEDAKQATAYLAVPVNSLAPRMATLEAQLRADPASRVEVRLAVNPAALRDAFGELKPAFWNPPGDRFAYGRTARTFLPADQGGSDAGEPGNRLYDLYMRQQIEPAAMLPKEVEAVDVQARADIAQRLVQAIAGTYALAFLEPPNPRERIQRGQFHDAARDLVAKQGQFARGLERLRNNPGAEQQFRQWAAEAQKLYQQLGQARLARLGKAPTPEGEAAIRDAEAAVENHWRSNGAAVQLLVDRVISPVGRAEATLLLAVCKHEEAEVAQARLEAAGKDDAAGLKRDAAAAWVAAAAEWRSYKDQSAIHAGYPGRTAHVDALAARAQKLATQK
jgi:hypothetical protein